MPFNDKSNSRFKLFSQLAEADTAVVSSSALTENLGMSRQAIFKLVGTLREEGLDIESIPRRGYALRNCRDADALSPTLINYFLKDEKMFSKCVYIPEVDSTQQVIKKLAAQGAPEGIIVVTDHQTLGRGRRGRTWITPNGKNLFFSVLLRPKIATGDVQLLNLAAALAVSGALKEEHCVPAEIKWPNDILARGKKLCGILSESAGEPDRVYYAITGIGVNVNLPSGNINEDIARVATSVQVETGKITSRPLLLSQIFIRFAALAGMLSDERGKAEILSIYRKNCATLGKEVRVIEDEKKYLGTARDITDQGAIIVNIDGRDIVLAAADIQHLRQV